MQAPEQGPPFEHEDSSTSDLDEIKHWLGVYTELMAPGPRVQKVSERYEFWKRRYAERRAELA